MRMTASRLNLLEMSVMVASGRVQGGRGRTDRAPVECSCNDGGQMDGGWESEDEAWQCALLIGSDRMCSAARGLCARFFSLRQIAQRSQRRDHCTHTHTEEERDNATHSTHT